MAINPTLLSLGHSCQTRFIIDAIDDTSRRMPFDFNITTRQALVSALDTDGASLRHDEQSARIFAMPSDGRVGIEVDGMFFWHDYPLGPDRLRLADGWQSEIPRVNEKYAALWSRFAARLRSHEPKTLMLSNTQHNLGQFAPDDDGFAHRFGLGRSAFNEVTDALDRFGTRNYRLMFITRAITDLAETIALDDERLDHRFVGTLSLRPDPRVPASISPNNPTAGMFAIEGDYGAGAFKIRTLAPNRAILYRRTSDGLLPFGSLTLSDTGNVAWFEGRNSFLDVDIRPDEIHFSDGTQWQRD
jgi:hypothetical protein